MPPVASRLAPLLPLLAALMAASLAWGDQARLPVWQITPEGVGETIGTIRLVDTKGGLRLTPLLKGLAPGEHAIAFHANGECGPGMAGGRKLAGLAAGGRFDPSKAVKQDGTPIAPQASPALPPLPVEKDGIARRVVAIAGLKLEAVMGRSLVIYAGDGRGGEAQDGARIACAIIR
jgi:Cu-Zn family superoxide dismutase